LAAAARTQRGGGAMNILDRYVFRTVVVYALMVMALLMSLGALFLFISQQDDVGVGQYTASDAFVFTLLNLPQQAFDLLPIGAMIGSLMGLGNLAASSELVVTRAAGISVWRFAWPVAVAGVGLALLMFVTGEYIAPPMAQYAKSLKTAAKLSDVSFAGDRSAWIKDGNRILRVQTSAGEQLSGGVLVFELDGVERLRSVQRAERIEIVDSGRWRLKNVAETSFSADGVAARAAAAINLNSSIDPEFVGLAQTDPTLLTLRGLRTYITHLRGNRLDSALFEIEFWARIARMAAVVVVTLLALPFVFGPLRSAGAGSRTVIGIFLGIVFFVVTRTIENGGQLFGIDPVLVGWLPTATVGLITLIAIARTR
jgi:lipopolysaccharide export system permease protein